MNKMIVFSGFNQRAVIAFLRTLDRLKLEYGIIALSKNDNIFKTSYAPKVLSVRNVKQIDLYDFKRSIIQLQKKLKAKQYVFAPSSEALNREFLSNKSFFESLNCVVPLVNKRLYELVSDKLAFSNLCKNNDLQVPKEYTIVDEVETPVVVKPKSYFSSKNSIQPKPKIILSQKELHTFVQHHNCEEFYFQDYVSGDCIYLLYYLYKNGNVDAYSQENLLQQEQGRSMLVAKSSDYHTKEISSKYIKLLQTIGYHGLIMIELKVTSTDAFMIEANPRFWGPSQLFVDANINLFHSFLYDNNLIETAPDHSREKPVKYFWDDGVTENFKTRTEIAFYNYDLPQFKIDQSKLNNIEIYNRKDTIEIYMTSKKETQINTLKEMYKQQSKHSNYQIMSSNLEPYLHTNEIDVLSRNEKARLDYILKHVILENKTIIDIGGNTGYFTLESINKGASSVSIYEGNKSHADFVKIATKVLEIDKQVTVHPEYYLFEDSKESVDVLFLLNVLHHVGDDYGDKAISKENARKKIISSLKTIAKSTDILVFQLGFNWKGDRHSCLFENGTKEELINFIKDSVSNEFDIVSIGIAEKTNNTLHYENLNETNIQRDDNLGEFLNRPLFIMKSKVVK